MTYIKNRFPRSVNKFIREEKGRIRKAIQDPVVQKEKIEALYGRFALMNSFKKKV